MSALNTTQEQLHAAWQALQHQWRASCALWDDPVSRRFEREFWQDFERVVPATMNEMQKLAQVIAQARRNVK
ncbi:MAG: hypothetical protein AB1566_01585 [Chloroflexota bacterium]